MNSYFRKTSQLNKWRWGLIIDSFNWSNWWASVRLQTFWNHICHSEALNYSLNIVNQYSCQFCLVKLVSSKYTQQFIFLVQQYPLLTSKTFLSLDFWYAEKNSGVNFLWKQDRVSQEDKSFWVRFLLHALLAVHSDKFNGGVCWFWLSLGSH